MFYGCYSFVSRHFPFRTGYSLYFDRFASFRRRICVLRPVCFVRVLQRVRFVRVPLRALRPVRARQDAAASGFAPLAVRADEIDQPVERLLMRNAAGDETDNVLTLTSQTAVGEVSVYRRATVPEAIKGSALPSTASRAEGIRLF